MTSIYDQRAKAFASVAAYVVLALDETATSQRVATIAFKHPRDGAGRLYAYVHWIGIPMQRGFASGGGYDKHTAACAAAFRKWQWPSGSSGPIADKSREADALHAFVTALQLDDGYGWSRNLEQAGFTVMQAV